jgi:hypothetical protein
MPTGPDSTHIASAIVYGMVPTSTCGREGRSEVNRRGMNEAGSVIEATKTPWAPRTVIYPMEIADIMMVVWCSQPPLRGLTK